MSAVNASRIANVADLAWKFRQTGAVIDGAGAHTVLFKMPSGTTRLYGLAVIGLADTGNSLLGVLVYQVYFDGTNLNLTLLLGSDVTGGGAHLTVANSNTYVHWGTTGGIQAIGQVVGSFAGNVTVDFLLNAF